MNDTVVDLAVNDADRLAEIIKLGILDSPYEDAFDRLTRLASRIVDAPVSLVSIVDADRQFFKSHFGLPDPWASQRETPLSHSFCKHVAVTNDPLVVTDAREVDFLKDNLAIPDLDVIAYLGMPLTMTNGTGLGSFCVIDDKPREWTSREIEIIRELSISVMTEVELRQEIKARRAKEAQLERLLHFTAATLDTMREAVERDAQRKEIMTYILETETRLDNFK